MRKRWIDQSFSDTSTRQPSRPCSLLGNSSLQTLPEKMVFRVYPNQSHDGNPRVQDEQVFPEETLAEGVYHGPWSVKAVVRFLWRNGKVPEWIDIAVESENGSCTFLALRCCGRFTAQEDLLYHRPGGCPPFSIKSPCFPPGLWNVEEEGKFDLHWREKRFGQK